MLKEKRLPEKLRSGGRGEIDGGKGERRGSRKGEDRKVQTGGGGRRGVVQDLSKRSVFVRLEALVCVKGDEVRGLVWRRSDEVSFCREK